MAASRNKRTNLWRGISGWGRWMLVGGRRRFLNKMIDERFEKCLFLESVNILLKGWGYDRRVVAPSGHLSPVSKVNDGRPDGHYMKILLAAFARCLATFLRHWRSSNDLFPWARSRAQTHTQTKFLR